MQITINSQFDSGNIEVVDASDPADIRLRIRNDTGSEFLQWFNFSASGLAGKTCTFVIENAGATTYSKGWENYNVACSNNRQRWTRVHSEYDGRTLSWTVEADCDQLWFAYFAPYSIEQHADLVSAAATASGVRHEVLGLTHQGRPIDYLRIGRLDDQGIETSDASQYRSAAQLQLWVIARQHPGESDG